ncbi:hypothetical protein F4680DRAFT_405414 [Xylaria scruposa]|nr:hypothetical protein F4680DRAFT_405414 [Xylaria scruposa]
MQPAGCLARPLPLVSLSCLASASDVQWGTLREKKKLWSPFFLLHSSTLTFLPILTIQNKIKSVYIPVYQNDLSADKWSCLELSCAFQAGVFVSALLSIPSELTICKQRHSKMLRYMTLHAGKTQNIPHCTLTHQSGTSDDCIATSQGPLYIYLTCKTSSTRLHFD